MILEELSHPLLSSSHQQHSFGHSTMATHTQHLQERGSSLLTLPNLSESNKILVMALGLKKVHKRMAENHKFHIDVVQEVAASQRCLEDEYACIMKQEKEEDVKD